MPRHDHTPLCSSVGQNTDLVFWGPVCLGLPCSGRLCSRVSICSCGVLAHAGPVLLPSLTRLQTPLLFLERAYHGLGVKEGIFGEAALWLMRGSQMKGGIRRGARKRNRMKPRSIVISEHVPALLGCTSAC